MRDTPWNTTWVVSANGGRNFQVFNVTDPTSPTVLAEFDGGEGHYLHTADLGFVDGQALAVLSSEDWSTDPSKVWIFDVTHLNGHSGEPAILEPIGTWENPYTEDAAKLVFSLHNPRFGADGIVTWSHYHGGLWQLDFRHPDLRRQPAPIAYAVYAEGTPPLFQDPVFNTVQTAACGFLDLSMNTPTFMDVELGPDGILYAADVWMGLYTFTPTEEHPVYGAPEYAKGGPVAA